MKRRIKQVVLISVLSLIAGYSIYTLRQTKEIPDLMMENIEALAFCEISRGDNIKLICTGEGTCSQSALGHTLTCDGTKVSQ